MIKRKNIKRLTKKELLIVLQAMLITDYQHTEIGSINDEYDDNYEVLGLCGRFIFHVKFQTYNKVNISLTPVSLQSASPKFVKWIEEKGKVFNDNTNYRCTSRYWKVTNWKRRVELIEFIETLEKELK